MSGLSTSCKNIVAAIQRRRALEFAALPADQQAVERQRAKVTQWLLMASCARLKSKQEAENAIRYEKEAELAQQRLVALINK